MQRSKKSTKAIGDMGFGGEELLLGGRLFPIVDHLTERQFKVSPRRSLAEERFSLLQITNLRLDYHKQSSIACSKCTFDVNLLNTLFDVDRLESKARDV